METVFPDLLLGDEVVPDATSLESLYHRRGGVRDRCAPM